VLPRRSFFGREEKGRSRIKAKILLERSFGGVHAEAERGYSLEDAARYLKSLGSTPVMTDVGVVKAKEAATLILSGAVKEAVVFGGPTLRVVGTKVFSTAPLPQSSAGEAEGGLTYSHRELKLAKMADLLLSMGVETANDYAQLFRDPLTAIVKAVDAYDRERKRGSSLLRELKSAIFNLLDIVADIVYVKEGDRTDAFTVRLTKYSRTGEFDELTDHAKHRLHTVRSLQRLMTGETRPVYKTFVETGKHYVIVFDKSGSMGETYRGATKKAMAAVIVLLIAKADPESKFSLVAFDRSAKVLAVKKPAEEVVGEVVDIAPEGGTSYTSGLAAADGIMEEGDVLVVVGDFLDGSPIPEPLAESIKSKAGKVLLIPVGNADFGYARRLVRAFRGEIYVYRNGVFELLP